MNKTYIDMIYCIMNKVNTRGSEKLHDSDSKEMQNRQKQRHDDGQSQLFQVVQGH